jgi:hypothetical protein
MFFRMLSSTFVRSYTKLKDAESVFGCRVSEIGHVFTDFLETKRLILLGKKLNGTV